MRWSVFFYFTSIIFTMCLFDCQGKPPLIFGAKMPSLSPIHKVMVENRIRKRDTYNTKEYAKASYVMLRNGHNLFLKVKEDRQNLIGEDIYEKTNKIVLKQIKEIYFYFAIYKLLDEKNATTDKVLMRSFIGDKYFVCMDDIGMPKIQKMIRGVLSWTCIWKNIDRSPKTFSFLQIRDDLKDYFLAIGESGIPYLGGNYLNSHDDKAAEWEIAFMYQVRLDVTKILIEKVQGIKMPQVARDCVEFIEKLNQELRTDHDFVIKNLENIRNAKLEIVTLLRNAGKPKALIKDFETSFKMWIKSLWFIPYLRLRRERRRAKIEHLQSVTRGLVRNDNLIKKRRNRIKDMKAGLDSLEKSIMANMLCRKRVAKKLKRILSSLLLYKPKKRKRSLRKLIENELHIKLIPKESIILAYYLKKRYNIQKKLEIRQFLKYREIRRLVKIESARREEETKNHTTVAPGKVDDVETQILGLTQNRISRALNFRIEDKKLKFSEKCVSKGKKALKFDRKHRKRKKKRTTTRPRLQSKGRRKRRRKHRRKCKIG